MLNLLVNIYRMRSMTPPQGCGSWAVHGLFSPLLKVLMSHRVHTYVSLMVLRELNMQL